VGVEKANFHLVKAMVTRERKRSGEVHVARALRKPVLTTSRTALQRLLLGDFRHSQEPRMDVQVLQVALRMRMVSTPPLGAVPAEGQDLVNQ
jgi:hypothetical protein